MTVTITINNNMRHCDKDLSFECRVEDCCCLEDGGPITGCPFCDGSGEVRWREYPNELNMANGNFSTIWNALGLDFDYFGEIEPDVLIKAIDDSDINLAIKDSDIEVVKNGPTIITFGIGLAQALRYHTLMREIATEAKDRGESVVWS